MYAAGASWPALMSPTKSTAASRAAKPRATPSSPSANANDTVIDLCDDLSPVRSNTRRGVPFPAHIQGDKSAAALAGNRKRLLSPVNRQHGSSTAMRTSASPAQAAQSSIAPMHASARGPQMDLTGKSKQDAVSYHQQLSAVAGHQWKESNQLHKRHRAHALVADTIQVGCCTLLVGS